MKLMIAALTAIALIQPGFAQIKEGSSSESESDHDSAQHFTLHELSTSRLDLKAFSETVKGPVAVTSSEQSEAEIEFNDIEIGGPYYESEEDAWRDADLYAAPDR